MSNVDIARSWGVVESLLVEVHLAWMAVGVFALHIWGVIENLTGQLNVDEIRNVMYGIDAEQDQITGLQSPTHFGRPNWKEIFAQTGQRHAGQTIGVFFCGPAVLSKQLYKMCVKFTDSTRGTRFKYHKENF